MKISILLTTLFLSFFIAKAQFATYQYINTDDEFNTNTYTLELNSMRGINFWATLTAKGDTDNYTIQCDVVNNGSKYIIKYKVPTEDSKGYYWQNDYMNEYWEHEKQPVLFIIEQGVGKVHTTFKEFKIKNTKLEKTKTLKGFINI